MDGMYVRGAAGICELFGESVCNFVDVDVDVGSYSHRWRGYDEGQSLNIYEIILHALIIVTPCGFLIIRL